MAATTKGRTIRISEEAYQALSHQAEERGKPMEEIASATILATLVTAPSATPGHASGEVYDSKTGKRLL